MIQAAKNFSTMEETDVECDNPEVLTDKTNGDLILFVNNSIILYSL